MKIIIQRVHKASVSVDGEPVSSIGKGLLVLLGITHDDTKADSLYLVQKLLNIRLWPDNKEIDGIKHSKPWMKSVMNMDYELLIVSQFTLYHKMKGNKPDFHNARDHEEAKEMYLEFIQLLKDGYGEDKVQMGAFGQYMNVELQNDGPVTIALDSIKDPKIVHKLEKEEKRKLKHTKNKEKQKKQKEESKEEVTKEEETEPSTKEDPKPGPSKVVDIEETSKVEPKIEDATPPS
ncbi:unnamed protein product [Moneuplotes crassus]|uniref:D-aminoacyl-tRNA deacylase n=1 Tax=Euplotes crassus TaxID=5936 RepID=A0AAD1XWT0_EUPCR|nr:unnamed protein product [Moneuplotes crassus]